MRFAERQPHYESRSTPDFTLNKNLAVMQLHQFFRERQADARVFMFARVRGVDLIETVEDFVKLFGRNAGAGVGDGDFDEFVWRRAAQDRAIDFSDGCGSNHNAASRKVKS